MNIIFKIDTWQEIYYSLKNNKLLYFPHHDWCRLGYVLFVSLLGAAKGMENGFDKLFSGFKPILFYVGTEYYLFRIMVSQKADN